MSQARVVEPAHAPGGNPNPVVNSHVHVAPNFSSFSTVADLIEAARAEGVRALGISNFYDQRVYGPFADAAKTAGILPLFGLELITLDEDLAASGTRVNDPANPGRMYLCGKGIDPDKAPHAAAAATHAALRRDNDARARAMIDALRAHLAAHGLPAHLAEALTVESITAQVAARAQCPVEWVSLQERHLAGAFQEALAAMPPQTRAQLLTSAYGGRPSSVDPNDAVALQGEVRARLMKTGTPGFVPEVPLTMAAAREYVLAKGGIPCYPVLADGVDPICPFEADPVALAEALLNRGIFAAELIPIRNASATIDAYVRALADAGLIVVAGTEHNTLDRIPLDPACTDGPVSAFARAAFFEGLCIVAAHQHEVAAGRPGYVDAAGNLAGDRGHRGHRERLAELGASLVSPNPDRTANRQPTKGA